jgi:hypothetical protein
MIRKGLFMVLLVWFAVFAMALPASAAKEEGGLSGEVEIAALSNYIWHGQELSRHSVVLQPSFTLSYKGFSANSWGNWDSEPYFKGEDHWNETDYTLSYEGEYGLLTFGAGYSYYHLPDYEDTQEVYLSLGMNTLLAPTLTVYKEVGHDFYWYFLLDVSHSFPLSEKVSLDLSASASYLVSNDAVEYPEVDGDGVETGGKYSNFHDGTLTVSLPVSVTEAVTITPTLSYTFPLCGDARREMKYFSMTGEDSAFLYGGVIFAYGF